MRRMKQLALVFSDTEGNRWGGKRAGAGRKPARGRKSVPHNARPRLASRFPVHVTTRIRDEVPRLRNRQRCGVIRQAMFQVMDEAGFRICQFSVQQSHLHLVCEAKSSAALARGIKRFKTRLARGLNRLLARKGSVFSDRYHMQILTTPRQTRNCVAYVMQNARRHGVALPTYAGGVDPYSSAWWFSGWRDDHWRRGLSPPEGGTCVSPAGTWLLDTGWRRYGLVRVDETPAAGSAPAKPPRRTAVCA